jgi:hypothetical protein
MFIPARKAWRLYLLGAAPREPGIIRFMVFYKYVAPTELSYGVSARGMVVGCLFSTNGYSNSSPSGLYVYLYHSDYCTAV